MCFLFQFMLNIFVVVSGIFLYFVFSELEKSACLFYAVINNIYTVILF